MLKKLQENDRILHFKSGKRQYCLTCTKDVKRRSRMKKISYYPWPKKGNQNLRNTPTVNQQKVKKRDKQYAPLNYTKWLV